MTTNAPQYFLGNTDMTLGFGCSYATPAKALSPIAAAAAANKELTQKQIDNGITQCSEPQERDRIAYCAERNESINSSVIAKAARNQIVYNLTK